MKNRVNVIVAISLVAFTALAGQSRHHAFSVVPKGLSATDWSAVQQVYLKASNTGTDDGFGWSVAVAGNTIVIGSSGESSSATGTNGNQGDDSVSTAGAVYVFVRSGTTWSQQAYLKASNTDAYDYFGDSVAIAGDTIVVGASSEDSSVVGVNGNQADNTANTAGAAYVFVRSGTSWHQQAYLKASNTDAGDGFGAAVGIEGDTIVVGAPLEDSRSVRVNGNQVNNSVPGAGAAYVFVRSGTTWSQQAYLKASNSGKFDNFGLSVAIEGETIVVGSYGEASNANNVNGNQTDNSASGAGAAYVFVRSDSTWSQQAYLKASNSDAGDLFGRSVAISGDTIVIGAYREGSGATGVNGNEIDNSSIWSGAAYVFIRNATTWSQQSYLKASNTDAYDCFGTSVGIEGDAIVVGAFLEDSNATGVNGNQANNSAGGAGAAFVYARSGTTWSQQTYLKASNTDAIDNFGFPVAIEGDTIVVAAGGEDSNASGVNGSQLNNNMPSSGAAYVFRGFSQGDYHAKINHYALAASGFIIEWVPVVGSDSVVKCSTNLGTMPFLNLSVALPYPVNSYTDTISNGECFYQVEVQLK